MLLAESEGNLQRVVKTAKGRKEDNGSDHDKDRMEDTVEGKRQIKAKQKK